MCCFCKGHAYNGTRVEGVCRKAVCNAYGVSHHVIDKAAYNIKRNIHVNEDPLGDKTKAHEEYIDQMRKIADLHDMELTDEQLAAATIAHSEDTLH